MFHEIIGEIMYNKSVSVTNISCGHCVRTIESELSALDNVVSVKADEETKMVDVSWNDPQTWENIKSLLTEINYPTVD
jgi:copper chaperone CopZ